MAGFGIFISILLVFAIIFFVNGFKVIKQQEVMIIERLGRFNKILEPGLQFIIPILDAPRAIRTKKAIRTMTNETYQVISTTNRIDLRETLFDFPPQNVITKDNVKISINALLYYQIVDPKSAIYEIENLPDAIEKLTQTTLRNIIGEMDLDMTLTSRDKINEKMRDVLDDATNKWGVKVNRVELQDIIPPKEIQTSMEKQMKAERDKRAAILEAEGQKQAAILQAEGVKESQIQRAEGEKQAAILKADGLKQARILEANGEAEAIRNIIEAIANKGQPDKYLIAMKYLETLKGIAQGENNKVVYMPYEATGVLSSIDGIKEMLQGAKK